MEKQLSVATVKDYLKPHGIEVVELPADTSTAVLAAQALSTEVAAIVKSLVFLVDGDPILVLASGDRRVNRERLSQELGGNSARLAPPDVVLRVTGYAVGGVPPVAHRTPIRTMMDRHLLSHPTVYAAAGAYNAVFPIPPSRLQELTQAKVTDATE